MSGRSFFHISKPTKRLILVMVLVTIIGIIIAWIYYKRVNEAEDPRVIEAKKWYEVYEGKVRENDAGAAMAILENIEETYRAFPDYRHSYEMGVVYNNRCALLLNRAMYRADQEEQKEEILDSAEIYVDSSIAIYKSWLDHYSSMPENEIMSEVEGFYKGMSEEYDDELLERIIEKRYEDIMLARIETPRRLSVALNNRGIIARHRDRYEEAIAYYKEALEVWPGNLNAENNIRILLGQPVEERSFIEKLFPPEKN